MSNIIDPKTGVRYQPVRKSYSAGRQKDYRERQKLKGRVCANWWVDEKLCQKFLYAARNAGLDNQMDAINYMLAWALSQWEEERSKCQTEVEATGLSDNALSSAHKIFQHALRQAFRQWTVERHSQRQERNR